tara:strand:- start:291 stop:899 length:609 start_codon:yes stop_codon:yes gene_type:complete
MSYEHFTNFGYISNQISEILLDKLKKTSESNLAPYTTQLYEDNHNCTPSFHMPQQINDDVIKEIDDIFMLEYSRDNTIPMCVQNQGSLAVGEPIGWEIPWMNIAESGTHYMPPHSHFGLYSFIIFVTLPSKSSVHFSYNSTIGKNLVCDIPLTPRNEGHVLIFPATILHSVSNFVEHDKKRVTISGNLKFMNIKEGLKDVSS